MKSLGGNASLALFVPDGERLVVIPSGPSGECKIDGACVCFIGIVDRRVMNVLIPACIQST